ncbi:hypothetical protein lerEdw1_000458 [Lerista edwardsae]|nr:hypothetical protein lerEdw1_000458 [Lerista edwardsae]
MAAGNGGDWRRLESALRSSLRRLRDKWGPWGSPAASGNVWPTEEALGEEEEEQQPSALEALPIVVKLYIMSFLTSKELSYLGSTNRYWRLTVQDPLLWRYLLIRDLPSWHSVDWKSLPDADIFNRSFTDLDDSAPCDYMEVYKKCCSGSGRNTCPKPGWSNSDAKAYFLEWLKLRSVPRFAMFGPGLEDLDESLVYKMMTSPEILPLAGLPVRQIHGIGSGVTFHVDRYQRINILTLYSKTSKERRRAREENPSPVNKMFCEETGVDGTTRYNLIEHVKDMCGLIDGFIYVADAEAHKKHDRSVECARMAAMLDPALGPKDRPVLILSCVSHAGIERIPCVYVAHQLQLNRLKQPWMVALFIQDAEATTLDGLLNGIEWMLGEM